MTIACAGTSSISLKEAARTWTSTRRFAVSRGSCAERGCPASPTLPGNCWGSRSARHVSPEFPKGYWPDAEAPNGETAWEESARGFHRSLNAMVKLVESPRTDLLAKIPWGDGQTILREALLVADHNAYHIGQLVLLRRALGAWPRD